jgi:hypothetical protein
VEFALFSLKGGRPVSAKPAVETKNEIVLLRPGVGRQVFHLPPGSTLADLLRAAQASTKNQEVLIGERTWEEALVLQPGTIVTLTPQPQDASGRGSWRETIGMFRDDPGFEEFSERVRASRDVEQDGS